MCMQFGSKVQRNVQLDGASGSQPINCTLAMASPSALWLLSTASTCMHASVVWYSMTEVPNDRVCLPEVKIASKHFLAGTPLLVVQQKVLPILFLKLLGLAMVPPPPPFWVTSD